MLDGPSLLAALRSCGITHVVWIPDSETGRWEAALASSSAPRLIRVCREAEAIAVAAGLLLGGQRPLVVLQCTGLFDAGDALRNVVHDLHLPLLLVVGVRSAHAHRAGTSHDNCPIFAEPIVRAWQLDLTWLNEENSAEHLVALLRQALAENRPHVVLLPE